MYKVEHYKGIYIVTDLRGRYPVCYYFTTKQSVRLKIREIENDA